MLFYFENEADNTKYCLGLIIIAILLPLILVVPFIKIL